MPEKKPEADNLFQKFGNWMKELVDWVEQTFGDPEMGLLIRADLGLNATAEVHPVPVSDATKATIADFVGAQDVDAAAFMSTVATIKAPGRHGHDVRRGGQDRGCRRR